MNKQELSELQKSFLCFDHAISDIVELHTIIGLLKNDNTCKVKNFKNDVNVVIGVIDLIKLAFKEEFNYLLCWLFFIKENIPYKFSEELSDHLLSLLEDRDVINTTSMLSFFNIRYNNDGKKKVTCDKNIGLNKDLAEAMKNAFKYAKSFIDIYSINNTQIIVKNDFYSFQDSGTKLGLQLHNITKSIEKDEKGIYFLATVDGIKFDSVLYIDEIIEISKNLGFTKPFNINGTNTSVEDIASLLNFSDNIISFRSESIKKEVLVFITDVLSKNLNSINNFWISKQDGIKGVNISCDFDFYSGLDFNKDWLIK
jgi:hypothetical protein